MYVKSFIDEDKNKQKIVQSVVVNIEGEEVSISTHERNATNVLNKIKRADSLIYMDKKTNPVAEQASSNKDVSVVSPTMTSGEDSHTSRTTFSNNSNKKSSAGISLIKVNLEEEHRNRSEAMKGNQNAKKDGVAEDDDVEMLKTNLNKLLQDKATKLPNTPFTRENYNNLFPFNRITTPLGTVK